MAQTFDPTAATAAYLARLPPEVHARAEAYTQGEHWVLLWGGVASFLVAWLILRSGALARLRSWAGGQAHPWRTAIVVLFVYALAEALLQLPWTGYARWWRERQYGLTEQPLSGWLAEWALSTVVGAVMTVAPLLLVYWLIRRLPRIWWACGGLVVAGFFLVVLVISPVLIEPLFNSYRPAPAGHVRQAVETLAEANGVPSDKVLIYDGSKQSSRYTANVAGLFGTARIALSDTMFSSEPDLHEVRAVLGHEMGHYVRGDAFKMAGFFGLLAAVGLLIVDRLFIPTARLMRARDVEGIADPAGYPVLSMFIAVLGLLATPILNTYSRAGEADADRFSLERVGDPDGMARALLKTVDYRAASPGTLEEVLFYSHPSVERRIRMAMEWKAQHSIKNVAPGDRGIAP